ncbi:MAG: DUF559 domain-containing protein, partial [Bacteroidetes bacterium]|nr:DUF559 domain-containing protein [Bacteroidota bacterium]
MFYGAAPTIFKRAEELRHNMTECEKILWEHLRNNKMDGYRFKAQHPILYFVVDFYCHTAKLVIEIDGDTHNFPEQKEYDEGRTYEMERFGITVLRFRNEQIRNNLEGVLDEIKRVAGELRGTIPTPKSPEGDLNGAVVSPFRGPGGREHTGKGLASRIVISGLFLSQFVAGQPVQHFDKTITLETPVTGSHDYQARDWGRLAPGFNYSAQTGQSFHLGINKNLILPADYTDLFTDATFDRSINTALPVGAIAGTAGVSPSGAATYTIPIYIPPGTAGMQPNLSIVYNSQSGNGLLGMGWDLAGLSAITRAPQTIYHDSKTEAVKLTDDDRFALDGNRLIAITGDYGDNNTIYHTEIETFNQITSFGASAGPEKFEVKTKEGLTMEYGFTADSRFLRNPANGSEVIAWYINKISDNYGNYISFTYANDGDGFRVQEINYSGTATQLPYNSIKFYYDKRTDANTFYIAGEAIKNNILVREIDVLCEGQRVKNYEFKYGYELYTYLQEIIETGKDGSNLNSTLFNYGSGTGSFTDEDLVISNNLAKFWIIDYNGDGKSDLVQLTWDLAVGGTGTDDNFITIYLQPGEITNIRDYVLYNILNDYPGLQTAYKNNIAGKIVTQLTDNGLNANIIYSILTYTRNQTAADITMGNLSIEDAEKLVNRIGNYLFAIWIKEHIEYTTIQSGAIVWFDWKLWRNDGNNNFTLVSTQQLESGFAPTDWFYPLNKASKGNMVLSNTDFNGDGNEDLIFALLSDDGINVEGTFNQYNSDGSALVAVSSPVSATTPSGTGEQITIRYLDLDGNLQSDILIHSVEGVNGVLRIRLNNDNSNTVQINVNSDYNFIEAFPVEIDGDGKTELANIFNEADKNYYLMKYENGLITFIQHPDKFPGHSAAIKLFGDFNGDGKTDILKTLQTTANTDNYDWQIAYSKGDLTFEERSFTFASPFYDMDLDGKMVWQYVQDINGDGFSDVIEIMNVGAAPYTTTTINTYINNGSGFEKQTHPLTGWYIDETSFEIDFGDFDGDGCAEMFVNFDDFSHTIHIIDFGYSPKRALLHSVLDGFNRKTTFEYKPLSEGGSFYTKGNSATYPLSDFQGPLYPVSSVTTTDGTGGTVTNNYSYEGAIIHKEGKGFLGFSRITQTNNITDIVNETESKIIQSGGIVYMAPCTLKTYTTDAHNISETTLSNNVYTYGISSKRYFPYNQTITTTDFLKDIKTVKGNFYNDEGNPSFNLQVFSPANSSNIVEFEYSDNIWTPKGSWGINNRLDYQTITRQRTGEVMYIASTDFNYNNQGKLTSQVAFDGKAKAITSTFNYDNTTGNLASTTISASGMLDRTTSIQYDTKGRFVTKTTNQLGQIAETNYDPGWGTPLMQKSIDGLITTYQYDGFGRLLKTKTPDNIETSYTLAWETAGGGTELYSQLGHRDGSPDVKTFYDILGRAVKTATDGFSQNIITLQTFNNKGQPATSSLPHYSGGSQEVTTYDYDDFGRIETEQNSAGTKTYSYSASSGQYTITVTDIAGHTSSVTTDASGKTVIASDDNGTTLTYTYYSNGQPKEIKLGAETLATMEYDEYARQTKLVDANAGETEYEYNAFGELTGQEDAKGNIYQNITYDLLGRITSKEEGTGNFYTYTYVPSGNGINQVQTITAPNGTLQNFSYDNLGRLKTSTETIDGQNYSTAYTYNNFNYISEIQYPSGFAVKREYDSKGYLKYVRKKSDNSLIWEGTEMNPLGQYSKYSQGNTVMKKFYNDFGMPTQYKTYLPDETTAANIQDYEFDWNLPTGNLNWRTDNIKNITETFTYDNLNRLKKAEVTGQPFVNMTYEDNGNIAFHSELGSYVYSPTAPNAVEKIWCGNAPYLPQQDITNTPFNKTEKITQGDY